MTLEAALMGAIGTLVAVVTTLAGAVVYLWKDNREQYRARAKDSGLYLHALERAQSKYSASQPPERRETLSDPPSLAAFYSTLGRLEKSQTRT